jgi:hypothetical protein
MPTSFQDRERAFEAKFAHDEAFRFRALARRDKLFARWAAMRLRLTDGAADALVTDVLSIPDKPGHDHLLVLQIRGLLSGHGDEASEADLLAALDGCMHEALRQLGESDSPDIL